MTAENLQGGEIFDDVRFRFIAFVERHARTNSLRREGEIRRAVWKLQAPIQLVPINCVTFEVFDRGDDAESLKEANFVGFTITYSIDQEEVYSFQLYNNSFEHCTDNAHIQKTDHGEQVAAIMLEQLEYFEYQGWLIPPEPN
jgi:hypothetical protein